jgi:hypothetical protein
MDNQEEGFIRPDIVILGDESAIPDKSLIVPPPNQFTHEVTRAAPFFFTRPYPDSPPAGELAPGTQVILLVYEGGSHCRVADGRGLYVEIEYDSLRRL